MHIFIRSRCVADAGWICPLLLSKNHHKHSSMIRNKGNTSWGHHLCREIQHDTPVLGYNTWLKVNFFRSFFICILLCILSVIPLKGKFNLNQDSPRYQILGSSFFYSRLIQFKVARRLKPIPVAIGRGRVDRSPVDHGSELQFTHLKFRHS